VDRGVAVTDLRVRRFSDWQRDYYQKQSIARLREFRVEVASTCGNGTERLWGLAPEGTTDAALLEVAHDYVSATSCGDPPTVSVCWEVTR
jgi:hypothetical protein